MRQESTGLTDYAVLASLQIDARYHSESYRLSENAGLLTFGLVTGILGLVHYQTH